MACGKMLEMLLYFKLKCAMPKSNLNVFIMASSSNRNKNEVGITTKVRKQVATYVAMYLATIGMKQ